MKTENSRRNSTKAERNDAPAATPMPGIILPPHKDHTIRRISPDTDRLIIIGANGTGKTRFTNRLLEDLGEQGYRISVIQGLYGGKISPEPLTSGVDRIYLREMRSDPQEQNLSGFERLLALLMHDEMKNLIRFKLSRARNPEAVLKSTRLDTVINLWQEVFPDNKVLIDSGKFLFTRNGEESYSSIRLSGGEKAVLYHIGAVAYAPKNAVIAVESPEMLLHPTLAAALWNRLEQLRPDCRFVYTTHDVAFASSRDGAKKLWVRNCDNRRMLWDYDILQSSKGLPDEVYMAIVGSRKPVLFIEGDGKNSIDSQLYPLIFKDYIVKSLGSCDKVIEATRTFNDLRSFHQLDSRGIVDRDRRDDHEVEYLRNRRIMVPEVAEIENILMLEDVIRAVASKRGKDENKVIASVKKSVFKMFSAELVDQVLQHTRHRVKRTVEYRIDGKFRNIDSMEEHLAGLIDEIRPRRLYDEFMARFRSLLESQDYAGVLKVFNFKPMLTQCDVAQLCGLTSVEAYRREIVAILHGDSEPARRIRRAVRHCFLLDE